MRDRTKKQKLHSLQIARHPLRNKTLSLGLIWLSNLRVDPISALQMNKVLFILPRNLVETRAKYYTWRTHFWRRSVDPGGNCDMLKNRNSVYSCCARQRYVLWDGTCRRLAREWLESEEETEDKEESKEQFQLGVGQNSRSEGVWFASFYPLTFGKTS